MGGSERALALLQFRIALSGRQIAGSGMASLAAVSPQCSQLLVKETLLEKVFPSQS